MLLIRYLSTWHAMFRRKSAVMVEILCQHCSPDVVRECVKDSAVRIVAGAAPSHRISPTVHLVRAPS